MNGTSLRGKPSNGGAWTKLLIAVLGLGLIGGFEWLRALSLEPLLIAFRLAVGMIDRIGPQIIDGHGVVFSFGDMVARNIEACDGKSPSCEGLIIPDFRDNDFA